MPFDQNTKARMFIKSARICCLCFKQCGTNIEAAHIIGEAVGGNNNEDNGIPLCFDCHQEIGGYDPKHPKGNKFTEIELKSRRNKIYELVESGFLQAQLITERFIKSSPDKKGNYKILDDITKYTPTKEIESIIELAQNANNSAEIIPFKLQLINEQEVAYIIDRLVDEFDTNKYLDPLFLIISHSGFKDKALIILEQILRKVTILNDLDLKNTFMNQVPIDTLKISNEGLREAFFLEIIGIIEKIQFKEVNKITNGLTRVQNTIPEYLIERYIRSLIKLIGSGSWQAEPIAKATLLSLPTKIATIGINVYDKQFLLWNSQEKFHRKFLKKYSMVWPEDKKNIFNDYLNLTRIQFLRKYDDID